MKKKMKIIILLAVLLFIAGIIINFLFVWGLCFEQVGGFKPTGSSGFLEDLFPKLHDSGIGIKNRNRAIGIPMILMVYPLEDSPYDIGIHLYDANLRMRKMEIETIIIKYDGGQEIKKDINCIKAFSDSTKSTWVEGQLTTYPVTRMDTSLSSLVTKSKSCTIKISGYLIDVDGKKIPFETSNHFDYEQPYWRVYTGLGSF